MNRLVRGHHHLSIRRYFSSVPGLVRDCKIRNPSSKRIGLSMYSPLALVISTFPLVRYRPFSGSVCIRNLKRPSCVNSKVAEPFSPPWRKAPFALHFPIIAGALGVRRPTRANGNSPLASLKISLSLSILNSDASDALANQLPLRGYGSRRACKFRCGISRRFDGTRRWGETL